MKALKPIVPYYGGKRDAAGVVWQRFGDVDYYYEPFCGMASVLLGRPQEHLASGVRVEVINDRDALIVNFLRAMKYEPEKLSVEVDRAPTQIDTMAFANTLRANDKHVEQMLADPKWCDVEIAAWFAIAASNSISGLRRHDFKDFHFSKKNGINCQSNKCIETITAISERLKTVFVVCYDFADILDSIWLTDGKTFGVFLDPPYFSAEHFYRSEERNIAEIAHEWAVKNGDKENMRIAYCCFDGDFQFPSNWSCVRWRKNLGRNALGDASINNRDVIWFSPHCLQQNTPTLFDL